MQQTDEMSFWDHLEELRWTLFRSILALFIFAIGGFAVMPWLFDNVVMAVSCEYCQHQVGVAVLYAHDHLFLAGIAPDLPLSDV